MSRKSGQSGRHQTPSGRQLTPAEILRDTPAVTNATATNPSALTRPSELVPHPAAPARASSSTALVAHAPEVDRHLPPPLRVHFMGGDAVTLTQDQLYADRVMIRKGERGRVMHPSSQAAAFVVHFPRIGPKYRVVPEGLLSRG